MQTKPSSYGTGNPVRRGRCVRCNKGFRTRKLDRRFCSDLCRVKDFQQAAQGEHTELITAHEAQRRNTARRVMDKPNTHAGRRKALIKANGGQHTRQEIAALHEAQGARCAYCKREGYRLHKDHVIPVKQGGTSNIDNMALACRRCNLNKGARTPQQWVNRWYLK
jgi:5-methylcytosine-specific restriction endonuclease McrA